MMAHTCIEEISFSMMMAEEIITIIKVITITIIKVERSWIIMMKKKNFNFDLISYLFS